MDAPTKAYFENLQEEYASDSNHRIEIVPRRPYIIADHTNDFLMLTVLSLSLSLVFIFSFRYVEASK